VRLREERIDQLVALIAARMPPRRIEFVPRENRSPRVVDLAPRRERKCTIRKILTVAKLHRLHATVLNFLDDRGADDLYGLSTYDLVRLRDQLEEFQRCAKKRCEPQ
jgi:hypothetical protein